ncbi:MAG: EMC3/TMCO1 family protein [Candidatus Bathyarchaeota archaeon]|nr:EMC3/TMCO1 family protein [Candidatus Bathyarchaeota archaeon]
MQLDLLSPPYSTFFIMLIAFISSTATALINRKFIDRNLLAEWRREISAWNAERELAKKTGDKKLMAKIKKQEVRVMQIRAKISAQQTKVWLITFIPLLIVWWLLISFYGTKPVAFIPLLGERVEIPFFFWYIICQFFFNFLISKLLNIEMGFGTRV